MFSFLSSFITSIVPGGSTSRTSKKKKKLTEDTNSALEDFLITSESIRALPPIGPLESFDGKAVDILDIESQTWSGILVGLSNLVDGGLYIHHSMHLQGKGSDPGGESSYSLSAMVRNELFGLSGRWSANNTRLSCSLGDGIPFILAMRGQLSSNERQNFSESDFGLNIGKLCLTLKTQSFYYWALSWSLPLTRYIGIGSEISMVPTPNSVLSRIKVMGKYSLSGYASVTAAVSTGTLPRPDDEFSLSYHTPLFAGCEAAAQYTLSRDSGKWSSVVRAGCVLADAQSLKSVKGCIDSNLKVVCVAEEVFGENSDDWHIQYSAKADFKKDVYEFGVGLFMSV